GPPLLETAEWRPLWFSTRLAPLAGTWLRQAALCHQCRHVRPQFPARWSLHRGWTRTRAGKYQVGLRQFPYEAERRVLRRGRTGRRARYGQLSEATPTRGRGDPVRPDAGAQRQIASALRPQ